MIVVLWFWRLVTGEGPDGQGIGVIVATCDGCDVVAWDGDVVRSRGKRRVGEGEMEGRG